MMIMLALRCRWLGEGMEGVAWEMNTESLGFLVVQVVFTIKIRSNNGVHEAEEKSRKPQIAIIE